MLKIHDQAITHWNQQFDAFLLRYPQYRSEFLTSTKNNPNHKNIIDKSQLRQYQDLSSNYLAIREGPLYLLIYLETKTNSYLYLEYSGTFLEIFCNWYLTTSER